MSIVQETTRVASKPRHQLNRRVRIRTWWNSKTSGNFTFGAIVGVITYMALSVVYNLVTALFF